MSTRPLGIDHMRSYTHLLHFDIWKTVKPNFNSWCTKQTSNQCSAVCSDNAMDKTPMYEMPLVFVCWLWGFGFWGEHFWFWGVGVLSLAFCPKIVLSSTGYLTEYVDRSASRREVVDYCLYVPINIAVPRELWELWFHTKLEPKLVFRIPAKLKKTT